MERKRPRERLALKSPKRLGQRGSAETSGAFVLQISSVPEPAIQRAMLDARGLGLGVGSAEGIDKGGLSQGFRPCFVKAAFIALPG